MAAQKRSSKAVRSVQEIHLIKGSALYVGNEASVGCILKAGLIQTILFPPLIFIFNYERLFQVERDYAFTK